MESKELWEKVQSSRKRYFFAKSQQGCVPNTMRDTALVGVDQTLIDIVDALVREVSELRQASITSTRINSNEPIKL